MKLSRLFLAALLVSIPLIANAASSSGAPPVDAQMMDRKMAYVKISKFDKEVAASIRRVLTKLQQQKPRGVIIDLRANGGGSIDAVIALLECFMPKHVSLFRYNTGVYTTLIVTQNGPLFRKSLPVVIIENETTNNESHIASAILQKSRGGMVIRETTDDSHLQTVVYGTSGRMKQYIPIKSDGFIIKPDIYIGRRAGSNHDETLDRAIDAVRELSPWDEPKKKR